MGQKCTPITSKASLDLIERNFQTEGSLYIASNERHAFFTSVVNFPLLDDDVARSKSFGVYIS